MKDTLGNPQQWQALHSGKEAFSIQNQLFYGLFIQSEIKIIHRFISQETKPVPLDK